MTHTTAFRSIAVAAALVCLCSTAEAQDKMGKKMDKMEKPAPAMHDSTKGAMDHGTMEKMDQMGDTMSKADKKKLEKDKKALQKTAKEQMEMDRKAMDKMAKPRR